MSGYLDIHTEFEKPVGIKENPDDQDTEGIEQMQSVPENIRMVSVQLIFNKCSYPVIQGVPEAEP
jgi:hypothetical protein